MSCGSLRSGPDQSKVLDPQLGWSDFRSDYGSASWRWLAAATRARWLSWDTIVSHTSHSIIRLLLMSGSMSEPSLVKIAGLKMKISRGCDKTVVLAEVVGVRRESIKVLFKNPSRMNVFLQIREVDKIETTSVSVWFLSWHEKQANSQQCKQEILLQIDTNTVIMNFDPTFINKIPTQFHSDCWSWLGSKCKCKNQQIQRENVTNTCKNYWRCRTTKLAVPVKQL